jgi:hypothetical protein
MRFRKSCQIEIIQQETVKMYFYLKKEIHIAMNPIVKMIALMIKVIIGYLKWINPSKTKLAKKIKIQILIYQKKNLLKFQLKIVIINQIKKMSK